MTVIIRLSRTNTFGSYDLLKTRILMHSGPLKSPRLSSKFGQRLWPSNFMSSCKFSIPVAHFMFASCPHLPTKNHWTVNWPVCLSFRLQRLTFNTFQGWKSHHTEHNYFLLNIQGHEPHNRRQCLLHPSNVIPFTPYQQDSRCAALQCGKCFQPKGLEKQWPFLISFLKQVVERQWYRRNWWWREQRGAWKRSSVKCLHLFSPIMATFQGQAMSQKTNWLATEHNLLLKELAKSQCGLSN